MKIKQIGIIFFVLLLSCNSASKRQDNNYFKFSESLKTIDYGTRTSAQEFKTEACNKLVVLINADCSLCYSEIWQWEKLVRKHKSLQKVPLAFIIYGETFKPNLRLMKGSGMLRLLQPIKKMIIIEIRLNNLFSINFKNNAL